MKQFYHQENEYADLHNTSTSINKFLYGEREILLVGSSEPILVVAGFIASEPARQREGFKIVATNVEPITDEAQRNDISALLSKKVTNKKVVFWGN